ncbi:MAG TPA: hypothetical protein PLV92_20705, partial [Pirellulaceae bacterium]|nr:hypothetical protein [Pirellulaceae bacterium]
NFPGANFGGITTGPAAVEGGYDTNTLFAIATNGDLYAFDGTGAARNVFFDNQSKLSTGVNNANGLAFSNLTRNLWQTTTARQGDAGHGISVPLDKTRDASSDGGSSFHFGLPTSQGYNYPGGAHGTLVSNPFSLKGYDATDKPMLYFNYFLATEPDDQDYSPGARTQPDSLRVFVAGDDGNWTLLATNDSYQSSTANDDEREYDVGDGFGSPPPAGTGCGFPSTTVTPCVQELFQRSNAWRQARISLERFAGQENLRLRFDFATAGSLSVGNISTTGEELRAVSANKLRDGQTITISGNAPASARFEVDLGPTLVVPSGARIDGGGSFTVTGPGGTRTFTLTAAATAGLNIQVNTGRTAEQIASDIVARVNAAAIGVNAVVTDGIRVNLSNLVSNVTVSGVVGMPANFVDGAAGITAGNVALRIRADMTAAQVAAILRTAMANTFAGGNLNSIKSHQDLVYMIRHSVTGQNTPAGATAFGLEVSLPGDSFGEGDETASSLTKMGTPSGSVSRRGVSNANEGAYIDDLIIGFAERGEMVTGAQTGAAGGMNFRDNLELSNANLPSKHTE